jgi:hypothetical protein
MKAMIVAAATVLLVVPALAARPSCSDGRFAVSGAPLLGTSTPADADAVALVGTTVAIASGCDAVEANLTPRRRATHLRVTWPTCRGIEGRVMLKGRLVDECRLLRATLVTHRRPRRRRFEAMRVPFDFVQPLDITFRYEDEHVIAFFDGHPEYEAVEAFVSDRAGHAPLIRAILTRHDKTQVDHLNDAAALAAYRVANPLREAVFADITYANVPVATGPHTLLDFVSFRGERIVFELFATSPASARFGGLTDPAGHAPDVLPILWRDASALAGPTTTLTIDGTPYTIPIFVQIGDFIGLNAFYTAGFAVGIVPTGSVVLQRLEAPEALAAGARWRYRRGDAEFVYEVVETDGDRFVIQRTSGISETIEARLQAGRLTPVAIRTASGSMHPGQLVFTFDPALPDATTDAFGTDAPGTFAIAIDDHAGLVTGRVEPTAMGFTLRPEQPTRAMTRAIRAVVAREAETFTIRTSVGP